VVMGTDIIQTQYKSQQATGKKSKISSKINIPSCWIQNFIMQ
jgi:hypothetical protein